MPRYSPWHPGAPPEQATGALVELVIRPSLRRAFPLSAASADEEHFRRVLEAMAPSPGRPQVTGAMVAEA